MIKKAAAKAVEKAHCLKTRAGASLGVSSGVGSGQWPVAGGSVTALRKVLLSLDSVEIKKRRSDAVGQN
jgi:hypothetical protein